MEKIVKNDVKNEFEKASVPRTKAISEMLPKGRKVGVLRQWQVIITAVPVGCKEFEGVTYKTIVAAHWVQTAKERAIKNYRENFRTEPRMRNARLNMKVIPLEEIKA